VSYSPDGRTLAAGTYPNEWRFWDLSAGAGQAKDVTPTPAPRFGHPRGASWTPDSSRLVVLTSSSSGCIGDVKTGAGVSFDLERGDWLRHLACSPAGRLFLNVASSPPSNRPSPNRRTRFELRDAEGGRVLAAKELETSTSDVAYSAFSADGRRVYAAFKHGLYRWAPESGEVVGLFTQATEITDLAVRDDERLALTTGGNTAWVWSLPEGKRVAELKHPLTCSAAAFLPNGRAITASFDGVVRIWDAVGGSEILALELGMGRVYSLAVSPDHMTFAAGVHKQNRIVLMDVPEP
jgi:WD40 repeat protein